MGTPLWQIIYGIGGGIPNKKHFKAVQTGGPSGGCIPLSHLNLNVDYESLKQAGAIMGSGGIVVMDEDSCMVDVADFSCPSPRKSPAANAFPAAKAPVKCMIYYVQITEGHGKIEDLDTLEELAHTISTASSADWDRHLLIRF